ncbi:MAG: transporter associated domain-containing protein [Alphaproteobacteria bacterium]|nr:transporter associated domain-containing protein [Alphaproteobacteria bacterium]
MTFLTRLRRFFKPKEKDTVRNTIEDLIEEIDDLIEDTEQKDESIQPDERQLLGNVLDLRDLRAEDVMVPRAEIIAAPDTITPADLLGLMVQHGYSSLPVYHETLDSIIGYVHIKDILSFIHHKKELCIARLMRKNILFISPAMQILDLLLEMKKNAHTLAIVTDEHGGTDGMVCFADLIEEIIGDIHDDNELKHNHVTYREDGAIVVDARIQLEDFEDRTKLNIPLTGENGEDIETLGGLINHIANRVPTRGEIISHPDGYEFEILEADPRRIKKIAIHKVLLLTDTPNTP